MKGTIRNIHLEMQKSQQISEKVKMFIWWNLILVYLSIRLSPPSPTLSTSDLCTSSRDDDDINDVASMAGVNLNEENARILATSSELVGTKIRSCKDESFLPTGLLHRRVLDTGEAPARASRGSGGGPGGGRSRTGIAQFIKIIQKV